MKKTIIIILLLIGMIIAPTIEFMWYHEQAHAQVCKLSGGTPQVKLGLPTSTTRCYNIQDEQVYREYNMLVEIVGYHLFPINTIISMTLFVVIFKAFFKDWGVS